MPPQSYLGNSPSTIDQILLFQFRRLELLLKLEFREPQTRDGLADEDKKGKSKAIGLGLTVNYPSKRAEGVAQF